MKAAVAVAEPCGVVTTTSTAPAARAGAVTVICVGLFTVKVAATPPKVTPVVSPSSAPDKVTSVPPMVPPVLGVTLLSTGSRA